MADLEERIRMVLVVSKEVKHTETQHVKGQADMAIVVKPVQHLNTDAAGKYPYIGFKMSNDEVH